MPTHLKLLYSQGHFDSMLMSRILIDNGIFINILLAFMLIIFKKFWIVSNPIKSDNEQLS